MQLGTKIDKLVIHDHNEKDLGLKSLIKQTGDAQDRTCNHLLMKQVTNPLWRLLAYQLSLAMKKPDFCLCKNKGADQLCSNCEADQQLCFCYTDSTIPRLLKSGISMF